MLKSILLELSGNPDIIMEANTGLWYNLSQPEKIR
ncbi:A/G-specific adenine glycosylase [Vibrio furnissii NCTC 11218]|nr:A/G-specific adenine glycosylase [Vibrio furnissii NCTC 11218]